LDVQKIKDFGYVDKEVSEIVQIISYFNYINRVADGLGLEPEEFIDKKGYKK
jgi:alkylhydroperoxidase family enzyme